MKTSKRSLIGLVALVLAVSAASQWWSGRHEQRLGEQVAALAQPGDIRMLSSETCAFCTVARGWFTEHRVPFSECMIERDAQCRADFDATRSPGTPVILVRGVPQVGFSPERVRVALQPRG
ncbi:MAG TPA: glutaredoxin domain-containing protein [Rubrivivax sp.]|nr:glutaredoxin domain-containing protein [Rubrivivax sp.]